MTFEQWFEFYFNYPSKEADSPAWVRQLQVAFEAGYKTKEQESWRNPYEN